jgi:hypothetical protein
MWFLALRFNVRKLPRKFTQRPSGEVSLEYDSRTRLTRSHVVAKRGRPALKKAAV